MRRALLWVGVAAAVVVGALASMLLFSADPIVGAPADELVIETTNLGSRHANMTLDVGPGLALWSFPLADGETAERRVASPPREPVPVRLTVEWSSVEGSRSGNALVLAEGDECPRGRILVTFRVETTRGVAIQPATECT